MRAIAFAALVACSSRSARPDPRVEYVGDPLGAWRTDPSEAHARNIWDLQAFDGRLYVGYGDAVVNTGPTFVIAFDPVRREFDREVSLNEEAIYLYRVIGDRLFVPGVDAYRLPDGALHVRDRAGWTKRHLASVVHANDVAVHGERLCVAVQNSLNVGGVACSRDDGATWKTLDTASWRSTSLFTLGDALYVGSHDSGVRRVDAEQTAHVAFDLPGIDDDAAIVIGKPTRCGDDEVVFIGKRVEYVKGLPRVQVVGAFRVDRTMNVSRIEVAGVPVDVIADDCRVVSNRALDNGQTEVSIGETKFVVEAMARSAELMDGYFYVGLGCEPGRCSAAAGRIVRLPAPQNGKQ